MYKVLLAFMCVGSIPYSELMEGFFFEDVKTGKLNTSI